MAKKQPVVATLTLAQARAAWASAGNLGGSAAGPVEAARGWARTLGGIDAYLALRARARDLTKAAVGQAVEAGQLKITPAVRGCIYLVPRADAALLLRFADDISARRGAREREKAGITPAELPPLMDAVLADLHERGPLTTDRLRRGLPEGAVRALGDAGKSVGISSTLPPALRDLETQGRIERCTAQGALDTERYLWRIPTGDAFMEQAPDTPEGRRAQVVARVLLAGGPTTLAELAEYTGAGKRDLTAALGDLEAVPVAIDGHADAAFVLPDRVPATLAAPAGDALSFLAFEDLFTVLHGGPGAVTDRRHHDVLVRPWGRGQPTAIGSCKHLASRSIVRGHELIGIWEYDPARKAAAWATFEDQRADEQARIDAEAQATGDWIARELGHARTFNLDRDEAVQRRADALRTQGIAGASVT